MYSIPEIEIKYKGTDIEKTKIQSSKDAEICLRQMYNSDTLEYLESSIVIFLNRANKTIGWFKLSQGGISGTIMDVRVVFAVALKCGASGIIISHNHPSGRLIPSDEDRRMTSKIKEAGKILDITLLDHIIITEEGYYSFADNGNL
jgi:DNA repair protein RadC